MQELQIAGNRVLSFVISDNEIYQYKLRAYAYEEFDRLYKISSETNMFRTPVDFNNPSNSPSYQWEATNIEFYEEFLLEIVNDFFNSDLEVKDSWFLQQGNDEWVDNPFHMHMTADWVAVTYLDVKPGDSILFKDSAGNIESYEPTFAEVLIFHGSAMHKPAPSVGSRRLTLNMEIGRKHLSEDEQDVIKFRFETCKSCDKFEPNSSNCSECGCFIPMKVGMMDEKCPIGKWGNNSWDI